MKLKEADMMTEISLLAPHSTAYLGVTVISERVLHTGLCSCDQSSTFCTCHTYNSCADCLHIPYAVLEYIQVFSNCNQHTFGSIPQAVGSTAQHCYLLLPSRNLLHDFCQEADRPDQTLDHWSALQLFALPILLLHTAIASKRGVLL